MGTTQKSRFQIPIQIGIQEVFQFAGVGRAWPFFIRLSFLTNDQVFTCWTKFSLYFLNTDSGTTIQIPEVLRLAPLHSVALRSPNQKIGSFMVGFAFCTELYMQLQHFSQTSVRLRCPN